MVEIADVTASSLQSGDRAIINRSGSPASVDLYAALATKQPIDPVLTATTASFTTDDETKLDAITGSNTGDQNTFSTIAVSGQSDVLADGPADTLTLRAGTNIDLTTEPLLDRITITADDTNLSYDAPTRNLISSTGSDVILPLVSSTDAGLAPLTGGGTTNFLRADGTWNVPPGVTDLGYTAATRILTSNTGTDVTLPLVGADAGLMTAADKAKLDGIASGAQVNVDTDLAYTASTRILTSSTGTDVTLPLVAADPGLMSAADKTKLDAIEAGAQVNLAHAYGQLTGNYTLTSTTAVQKLFNWSTNGTLTLGTGRYLFSSIIHLQSMSATSGNGAFHLLGAGTSTMTNILYQIIGIDNTTPLVVGTMTGSSAITQDSAANMVTAGVGTGAISRIHGIFQITVAGTIIPSIALTTAAAAIVQQRSYFECIRIGSANTGGTWT